MAEKPTKRGSTIALVIIIIAGVVVIGGIWGVARWWGEETAIEELRTGREETVRMDPLGQTGNVAPELVFDPGHVDFGIVDYETVPQEGYAKKVGVRLKAGGNTEVLFGTATWDVKPGSGFDVDRTGSSCFDRVVKPEEGKTKYCEVVFVWQPEPGEKLDTKVSMNIGPYLDLDSMQARQTWEEYPIEVRVTGQAKDKPPEEPLTAEPGALDLGQGPKGDELKGRVELRSGRQPIEIETVVWEQPVGDEVRIEHVTCAERLAPEGDDEDARCILEIGWNGEGEFSNDVVITWRYDGRHVSRKRQELRIPVNARRDEEKVYPEGTVWLTVNPEAVDFGSWEGRRSETFNERVVLTAGPEPVTIEEMGVFSKREELKRGVRTEWAGCTRTGGSGTVTIEAESFCELTVKWEAEPGSNTQGSIRIAYRANTKRYPVEIDFSGNMKEHEVSVEPVDEEERRLAQARRNMLESMAEGSLERGIGIIGIGHRDERRGVHPGAVVDADYGKVGVDASGVSSRPVKLQGTVLHGTGFLATIEQSFDARVSTPITAVVAEDVYSAHGRNKIIPRGTRIAGRTVAFGGSATGVDAWASAMTTAGDAWIHVQWERITRRDGTAFVVRGHLATTDEQGTAGIPGLIDLRELERYVHAVMTAIPEIVTILALKRKEMIVTTDTAIGREKSETKDPRNEAADLLAGRLGSVANEMAQGAIPKPTVEVAAGTIVRLVTTRDLWLRPARGHLAYPEEIPEPDETVAEPQAEPGEVYRTSRAPVTARERLEEQRRKEQQPGETPPGPEASQHAWERGTQWGTPSTGDGDTWSGQGPRRLEDAQRTPGQQGAATIPAAGNGYGPATPPGMGGSRDLSWEDARR